MGKLLKLSEVADWLGFHRNTVEKLVKTGVLPAIRIGRSHRFDPDAVKSALLTTKPTTITPQKSVA